MSTSTKEPPTGLGQLIAGAPAGPSTRPSQHRQLTVMFADLVGSTTLLEEHGPEAFSDLLRVYHNLCTEATRAQDGTVANYLGDGVISYFGYPRGMRGRSAARRAGGMDDHPEPQADERQHRQAARACRAHRHRHRPRDHPPEGRRSLWRERRRRLPEQGGAAADAGLGKHRDRLRRHAQAGRQGVRVRESRARNR